MKKEIKVVAIILVALIVFLSGYGLGASKGITITIGGEVKVNGGASVNTGATVQTPAPQTTAPTTQAPTTQAPAGDDTTTKAPSNDTTTKAPSNDTTEAPSNDGGVKVPSGNAEIAAAYNKAVNDYKAYTGKVTLKKTEAIDVKAKDIPSAVEGIVNGVIKKFITSTTEEFTFENGVDVNDPARYVTHKMVPNGRDAEVKAEGLASATATPNADGGYTMKIKFVQETSIFNGKTNETEPTYHKGAMDPLDLGTLEIDPIKITKADMTYPGAEVEATVDAQGRLVKLHNYLPLGGSGTGSVAFVTATIGIEGNMDTVYEITYA